MVCIQVASLWFELFGLGEILGHVALAGVGFCGVVVWLEGCILGRSSESEGWDGSVDLDELEVVGLGVAEVGDLGSAEVVGRIA